MVNQITSSTSTQRSIDGSQLTKVTTREPITAVAKVTEKKELNERKQHSAAQPQSSLLVQTSRANHQVSQAQSAVQALKEANGLLGQLRNMARRSLNAQESKKDQLQQTLHQLKGKLTRLTKEANYAGEKLLHHDLTPKVGDAPQTEQFSIKGMRFNSLRQQGEILRFQFDEGQPSAVRVKIEPHQSIDEVATELDKALSKRAINVNVDRFGELEFSVPKEEWPAMRKGVWMSGAGQILPAGNPVKAKLENHDKAQVEPEDLEFGKPQSTRKALADIDRMMHKVSQSLAQIEKQQQALVEQLDQVTREVARQRTSKVDVNRSEHAGWLDSPEQVSLNLVDNAVPTLLAQANATRHNVVALLEPAV